MKKSNLLIVSIVGISLFGCGGKKTISNKGNVKLTSMVAYVSNKAKPLKALNLNKSNDTSIDYQYIVLQNNVDNDFDVKIELSNPSDYHILDFNLTCDDENLEVLSNGSYAKLNELKSINWLGSTNESYIMHFRSSSQDFLSTLKISDILYIDREQNTIKYYADISTNNEVEIYRVNPLLIDNYKITNNELSYTIEEYSHIIEIKGNNEEIITGGNKVAKLTSNVLPNLDFDYKYSLGNDITYESHYVSTFTLNDLIIAENTPNKNDTYAYTSNYEIPNGKSEDDFATFYLKFPYLNETTNAEVSLYNLSKETKLIKTYATENINGIQTIKIVSCLSSYCKVKLYDTNYEITNYVGSTPSESYYNINILF